MSQEVERYLHVNGVRLWTVTQGTGMPLVLCHGGPGIYDYLEPVARMIDDLAMVVRYDQRGCGRSEARPPYDVVTLAEDLEALRRRLRRRAWIVGGHSWGANLALAYALAHPHRTRALLYLCGTGIDPAWHDAYERTVDARLSEGDRARVRAFRSRLPDADPDEERALRDEIGRIVRSTDFHDPSQFDEIPRDDAFPIRYDVNKALNRDWEKFLRREDVERRLEALRLPTLVVHGEGDPRPAQSAKRLAERVPDAVFRLLPRAGHDPWWENPEDLRATLRAFLQHIRDGLGRGTAEG